MKKLVILILLFLVACTTNDVGQVKCVKDFEEPLVIKREMILNYRNNKIVKIENSDQLYFDTNFTKADFEKLEIDLADKLAQEKNIEYAFEYFEDYVLVASTLVNVDDASARELTFIGIEKDEKEFTSGLEQTIRFNEKEGFVCEVVDN